MDILHASFSAMEKIALKGGLDRIQFEMGLNLCTIVTDQHSAIKKMLKDEYPSVNHQYDVWHLRKNLRNELSTLGKKKAFSRIGFWQQNILNHLYYACAQCNGNYDELLRIWHGYQGKKMHEAHV